MFHKVNKNKNLGQMRQKVLSNMFWFLMKFVTLVSMEINMGIMKNICVAFDRFSKKEIRRRKLIEIKGSFKLLQISVTHVKSF